MLVNRRTIPVKVGCIDKMLTLLKGEKERLTKQRTMRVYRPVIGPPFNIVVVEIEFEDLGDYEKFWAEWFASPEAATIDEKWDNLIEPGQISQIWRVIE